MTVSDIRQQILEHLEILPSEQVKTLLLTWLTFSEGDLEDFERLLSNQPTQTTEESFEYGEIDAALNFQPLTEAEMVEQSKSALEAYSRKVSGVPHNLVREWGLILTCVATEILSISASPSHSLLQYFGGVFYRACLPRVPGFVDLKAFPDALIAGHWRGAVCSRLTRAAMQVFHSHRSDEGLGNNANCS